MPREIRRRITEPEALEALSHPVRLELMNHLMASGPATASACARAVGDTPSNCSYHLRVLAGVGLVGEDVSADGRERPWRALVTGFQTSGGPLAVAVQRDQRLARELSELRIELDALIRPYIAATREEAPTGSSLVHLGLHAFPTEP
jgi:DNA-binding transcriptional ArsR family regulator